MVVWVYNDMLLCDMGKFTKTVTKEQTVITHSWEGKTHSLSLFLEDKDSFILLIASSLCKIQLLWDFRKVDKGLWQESNKTNLGCRAYEHAQRIINASFASGRYTS